MRQRLQTSCKVLGSVAVMMFFLAYANTSFAALVKKSFCDSTGQPSSYYTYEYNASGQKIKHSYYSGLGELIYYEIIEYNASGLQTKYTIYPVTVNGNGWGDYAIYEYNASDLMTKESNYDASGELFYYRTFEYNASGLMVKYVYTCPVNPLMNQYYTYEYNASGLKTKALYYTMSNELTHYSTYEYNASGLMTKDSRYDASGQLTSYFTFEYNAQGLVTKEFSNGASGQPSVFITYEYDNRFFVTPPALSLAAGTYTKAQSVALSSTTPGATIRYTTNGAEPNVNSTAYISPISISTTTTIKAKAFNGGVASATTIGIYTLIQPPALTPVFHLLLQHH